MVDYLSSALLCPFPPSSRLLAPRRLPLVTLHRSSPTPTHDSSSLFKITSYPSSFVPPTSRIASRVSSCEPYTYTRTHAPTLLLHTRHTPDPPSPFDHTGWAWRMWESQLGPARLLSRSGRLCLWWGGRGKRGRRREGGGGGRRRE